MSDSEHPRTTDEPFYECGHCKEVVNPEVVGHAVKCPACGYLMVDPQGSGVNE